MDFIFQKFCDYFPPDKMDSKIKKKFFYFIFSIFKFFLKGPFNLNFGNFNFYAYPQKADYTKFMLTRVELPDPRERKIIKQNLNGEQNLFIDCGANAGFYSLDIWSSVNNCKIYAFEPSVKERYFLNENLKLNKAEEIKVIDFAVGDKNGLATFNDTRDNSDSNSSGGGYITEKKTNSPKNYDVKIVTLDEFFKNKNNELKKTNIFIKIDLEGYDFKAIKGAKNLILNNDCSIVFEFSKMITSQKDYSKNYLDEFLTNNFKLYDMHGTVVDINELESRLDQLDDEHDTCGNFFLSKKELDFTY